jgi:hypothetical protein
MSLNETRRDRDHRPRRLHAGAQVPELARRGAFVRLARAGFNSL